MKIIEDATKPGSIIDHRYRVERLLGAGATGWVLLVADEKLNRQHLALKLLYPHLLNTESAFARFRHEVSITRRLSHPLIVQTFDYGRTSQGFVYLTMEYVSGRSLGEELSLSPRGLPLSRLQAIMLQLLEVLRYAHTKGIIHRDLKPENILLAESGSIKAADFGLAQFIRQETNITKTGALVGTPFYMSPEQIRGEQLGPTSDIYSLGIMLYELACGTVPFQGETFIGIAEKHIAEDLPPLPQDRGPYPSWFGELLGQCAAKDPFERPGSAAAIFEFLEIQGIKRPAAIAGEVMTKSAHETALEYRFISAFRRAATNIFGTLTLAVLFSLLILLCHTNTKVADHLSLTFMLLEKNTGLELRPLKQMLNIPLERRYRSGPDAYALAFNEILLLVRIGFDPNTTDPRTGDTLLHLAVRDPSIDNPSNVRKIIRLLFQFGADPNLPNFTGQTPAHEAARLSACNCLQALLKAGAKPDTIDRAGWTPLGFAIQSTDLRCVTTLLIHRANPNLPIADDGRYPLHLAAESGNAKAITQLLEYGADPSLQDAAGRTALMAAIGRNKNSLDHEELLKQLAQAVPPHLTDRDGKTAQDYARDSRDDAAKRILGINRQSNHPS